MIGLRCSAAIVLLVSCVPVIWADDEVPARRTTVQKTYAVADLVVPINMDTTKPQAKDPATTENDLIGLIRKHVAPGTWTERGPGVISYFPQGMSLVITHTPDAQAEIGKLLHKLRRELDKEISVEMRFVSISEAAFEALKLKEDLPKVVALVNDMAPGVVGPLSRTMQLDDKQVSRLLESVQGDRRTNIMQSPKITMFNGQKVTVTVGDQQSYVTSYGAERHGDKVTIVPKTTAVTLGHQHVLQPVVEADGKTVRLAVKLSLSSLSGPVPLFPVGVETTDGAGKKDAVQKFVQQPNVTIMDLETTFKIPADRTQLVVLGTMLSEVRTEYGPPPYLSRVPYVNRLFRNVSYGRESQHVLVLLTPRIVAAPEETAAK